MCICSYVNVYIYEYICTHKFAHVFMYMCKLYNDLYVSALYVHRYLLCKAIKE